MKINKELAQFCVDNNNMNKKRAENYILINQEKSDYLRNLQWDFNELCISYFLETTPQFWNMIFEK